MKTRQVSHCKFGPDSALYVVDFGIIHIAPEAGAIRYQIRTDSLWRIRRISGPQGLVPRKPVQVPLYLLQALALVAGVVGAVILSAWLMKRLKGRRNRKR